MTNFQGGTSRRLSREQVLLFTPILLGAVVSAAVGMFVLIPALQKLQSNQNQLADLREQEARIPMLRRQLSVQLQNMEKAQQHERQILQLIAGSGDISTFISQLGQEARRSGIQLDSYEPVTSVAPAPSTPSAASPPPGQQPSAKPNGKQPPVQPVDPLLAPGLQKTTLLITARGSGPQLQDFLRRLERLSLLVVQSDLSLKVESSDQAGSGSTPPAVAITTLKLNLALYSKAPVGAKPQPPVAAPAKS